MKSKPKAPPRSVTAVRIRDNWKSIALQARFKYSALVFYCLLLLALSWWFGLAIIGEIAQSYIKPK